MMNKDMKRLTITLIASLAVGLVAFQLEAEAEPIPNPPPNSIRNRFGFDDLVSTGKSELGGDRVHVHVPGIVSLDVDRRPEQQGARLKLTIMYGLVSVNLDRVHHKNGLREGPIDVRVFWIPFYQNKEAVEGIKPREPNPLLDNLSNLIPQNRLPPTPPRPAGEPLI